MVINYSQERKLVLLCNLHGKNTNSLIFQTIEDEFFYVSREQLGGKERRSKWLKLDRNIMVINLGTYDLD